MKKRIVSVLLIAVLLFACSACGGGDKPLGLMPTRVENLLSGGEIPEGSEATAEAENPAYDLAMLWGTWVLEDWDDERGSEKNYHVTDRTIELPDEFFGSMTFEWFPAKLTFSPAWAGISFATNGLGLSGRGFALSNTTIDGMKGTVNTEPDPKENAVNDPFGVFMESLGYGLAAAEFQAPEKVPKGFSFLAEDARKAAYTISGGKLALGITNEATDGSSDWGKDYLDETDLQELDFDIQLKGYRMTLTNGEDTATYIPLILAENGLTHPDMPKAGLVPDYERLGEIYGITLDPEEGNQIMGEDTHRGYEPADVTLGDDGKADIRLSDGTKLDCGFYYSGDSLTLLKDGKASVYSLYERARSAQNQQVWSVVSVGDGECSVGEALSRFVEQGLQTNLDLNQEIPAAMTTEAFPLKMGSAEISVKVTNPVANAPSALKDCIVSWMSITKMADSITFWDRAELGSTTMEEILLVHEAPYNWSDSVLQYKAYPSILFSSPNTEKGDYSISPAAGGSSTKRFEFEDVDYMTNPDVDAYYIFDNGVLIEFREELPALLYYGLQDNVAFGSRGDLTAAAAEGIIQKRDTILQALQQAFQDANIDVDINAATGEITMNNDVLFDTDQYEISEAGKQYIDEFMRIYAGVVARPDLSGSIERIMFEGHTDSSGSYDYNLELSQNRAKEVMYYCVESVSNGLDDQQRAFFEEVSASRGYSFSDLVYDEDGNEDMDASRRVAIKFFLST